jgi:hypothetical protein
VKTGRVTGGETKCGAYDTIAGMTSDEIIDALSWYTETFPRSALLEVPEHREELTPRLLDALDKIGKDAERVRNEEPEYDLFFYALFLLAQFREKQAFPRMIRILKLEEDFLDFFLGDLLSEGFDRCLCSVYDGNLDLLKEIIEDKSLDEYARSTALSTCGLLFQEGLISRKELCEYLRFLMKRFSIEHNYVPTALISLVTDEHLFELKDEVKAFYKHNVIDSRAIGNYDSFINSLFNYSRFAKDKKPCIDDTIKELEFWAKYQPPKKTPPAPKKPKARKSIPPLETPAQKKKIGRNDPCPCGSGKKYKKCCLLKQDVSLDALLSALGRDAVDDDEVADEYEKYDKKSREKGEGYMSTIRETLEKLTPKLINADEIPYDLLTAYPALDAADARRKAESLSKSGGGALWMPKNPRYLSEFYSLKAIKIDIPVYKALFPRSIPLFVKRNYKREYLEKIDLLKEAFELFTQTCAEEGIKSLSEFDAKYMVHYEAAHWLDSLFSLLDDAPDPLSPSNSALKNNVERAIKEMS